MISLNASFSTNTLYLSRKQEVKGKEIKLKKQTNGKRKKNKIPLSLWNENIPHAKRLEKLGIQGIISTQRRRTGVQGLLLNLIISSPIIGVMAYVCRAHGEIEARIVFHVKYGGDGREWRTSKDSASDQIGCLSKTIGTRVEYAFHGKRNFANKWLNHGVDRRDAHSKREAKICTGIHTSFRNGWISSLYYFFF